MADGGANVGKMGGYPVTIFAKKTLDIKYLCNYCSLVLKDPVQSFCGHRFCRICVDSHVNSGERCKQCEREGVTDDYSLIQKDQMFPDNAVKREMHKLTVVCCNSGCDWTGSFKELELHYDQCNFRQAQCLECGTYLHLKDLDHHRNKECPQRLEKCQKCNTQIKSCEMEVHLTRDCPKVSVQCPVCGKENLKENLQHHTENECSSIICPAGCGEPVATEKIFDHLNETQVSRHIEPIVNRMTQNGSKIQQLQRVTDSLERALTENNDKMLAIERQLVDVMNLPNLPRQGGGEVAAVNVDQKIRQSMEIQQGSNNEKFQQLEVKTGTFEGIVSALHREIEKTINAIERMEQNRRVMKETLEQSQAKLRTLERTIAVKDVAIAELELRVQSTEFASYDGYFIWKVPDFTKKQQDAIQGRSISIYSPPFYTSRRGYKMCARLYPNGDGMGKGTHLSLFFVVMRGNFDALQAWPFKQRVTFCLINQNGKEHVLDSFRPDQSSSSFKRPTSDMNIASGCPLFLRLENLQNSINGFLKDDTLFVKVMVDLNDPPLTEPLQRTEDRIYVAELTSTT